MLKNFQKEAHTRRIKILKSKFLLKRWISKRRGLELVGGDRESQKVKKKEFKIA